MPSLWFTGPAEFGCHSLLEPLPPPDPTPTQAAASGMMGHHEKQNLSFRPYLTEVPTQPSMHLQSEDGSLIPTPRTGQGPESIRTTGNNQW